MPISVKSCSEQLQRIADIANKEIAIRTGLPQLDLSDKKVGPEDRKGEFRTAVNFTAKYLATVEPSVLSLVVRTLIAKDYQMILLNTDRIEALDTKGLHIEEDELGITAVVRHYLIKEQDEANNSEIENEDKAN